MKNTIFNQWAWNSAIHEQINCFSLINQWVQFSFWSKTREKVQTSVTAHKGMSLISCSHRTAGVPRTKRQCLHSWDAHLMNVCCLTLLSCPGGGRLDLVISDSSILTYDDLLGFSYQVAKGMEFLASKNVGYWKSSFITCSRWPLIVRQFEKYPYSVLSRDLEEKIDTTLMCTLNMKLKTSSQLP